MSNGPVSIANIVRVVVVDDDATSLEAVRRCLRRALPNADVLSFDDGAKAFDAIRAAPPSLVVSDWHMTGMAGEEFVALLEALAVTSYTREVIPVIVVSEAPSDATVQMMLGVGAHEVIDKGELGPERLRALYVRARSRALLARNVALERARSMWLAELTREISFAGQPEAAVGALSALGPRMPGVEAGSLFVIEGDDLVVAAAFKYSAEKLAAYRLNTGSEPTPFLDAIQQNREIFIESRADFVARYPSMERWLDPDDGRGVAWSVTPLRSMGVAVGALGVRLAHSRLHDAAGKAFVASVSDLLAQALDRARLHEAERARREGEQRFLGIVSHDLRNPLNAIVMASSMLRDQEAGPTTKKLAERLHSSAERMTRLVNDLVDQTSVRVNGSLSAELRLIDLAAVTRDVAEEMKLAFPAAAIEARAPSTAAFQGDQVRLAQLISNLVRNAVVHGAEGEPILIELSSVGDTRRLAVENRGPTIPPDALVAIFEPFERRASRSQGLGLGLFIAREIVRAHGGRLTVHSEAGVTRFEATFASARTARAAASVSSVTDEVG